MKMKSPGLCCALSASLISLFLPHSPAQCQDVLVKDARVITLAGPELSKGAILIQEGRITAVGADVQAPPEVSVINAKDLVAMPGFVLAHTSEGLDRPNEVVPVAPYVSVLDSLDPASNFFEDSLRDGHLTLCVMPGSGTVIGGMGRIVQPRGLTVEDMTVVAEPGLKLSLIPPQGNRASHLARLRAALDDAKAHLEKKKHDSSLKPEDLSGNWSLDLEALQVERRKQALLRLLLGEYPAYVACGTAADVLQALKLAGEYAIKVRLVCGPGTWRAAPLLAEKKIPVILTPELEVQEFDPEAGKDVRRIIPKLFHDAGVRFALTSTSGSLGRRYLWYQAACLVRYGIPREQALAAVTSTAAELIGLGDRKGSLAKGMDGDLVLLTDDPLSGRAWVDRALVLGRVVYERNKDPRLAEIFGQKAH
jgi:imidazolonepropionase-like amidohydrolase